MQNPRLASRYAKSLIDIAIEQNSLEATLKDVQLIAQICKQNSDFLALMRSSIIKADKKNAIVEAIFNGKISTLTSKFFKLLIDKNREQNIDDIAAAFIAQYRYNQKIKMVKLTTASAVDNGLVETLRSKVAVAYPGSTIEFETAIDPNLLGGFVLDLGDKQLDASIIHDINSIRKQFNKNLYVAQMH